MTAPPRADSGRRRLVLLTALAALCGCLLAPLASAGAEKTARDGWTLRTGASFGSWWGTGAFTFKLERDLPEVGGPLEVQSDLRWSREVMVAGIEVFLTRGPVANPTWEIGLEVRTNVVDPVGRTFLNDIVWSCSQEIFPTTLWWTEASTHLQVVTSDLSLKRGFWLLSKDRQDSLYWVAGLGYDHARLEAMGLSGWRLDDHLVRVTLPIDPGRPVEIYEAHVLRPQLGCGMRFRAQRTIIDFQAHMGGAFSWDERESLVKQRRMSARAYGFEAGLRLSPYHVLPVPGEVRRFGLYFGLDLHAQMAFGAGTLEQSDTGGPSAPIADSDLEVLRFSLSAMFRVGLLTRL